MHNKRSFGSLVGTAASIVMTVVQTTHPSWLGNHPWILTASLLFLCCSVLLFLTQFRWFQRLLLGIGEAASQETQPGQRIDQSVGRDNSGRMFAAGTLNYHEGSSKEAAALQGLPPIRRPNLIALPLIQLERGTPFSVGAAFEKNLPYVLPVENRIPEGIGTKEVSGVGSSIRFIRGGEGIAFIPRAYWRNSQYQTATIEVQAVQSVVLGRYLNREWIGYENSYRRPYVYSIGGYDSFPNPIPVRVPLSSGDITAEVVLFDTESGDEYLRVVYVISEAGDEAGDNDVKIRRLT
jgi:hypothetical protein